PHLQICSTTVGGCHNRPRLSHTRRLGLSHPRAVGLSQESDPTEYQLLQPEPPVCSRVVPCSVPGFVSPAPHHRSRPEYALCDPACSVAQLLPQFPVDQNDHDQAPLAAPGELPDCGCLGRYAGNHHHHHAVNVGTSHVDAEHHQRFDHRRLCSAFGDQCHPQLHQGER